MILVCLNKCLFPVMDGRSCQEHTIPLTKFATSLFDDIAMSKDSVKLSIFSPTNETEFSHFKWNRYPCGDVIPFRVEISYYVMLILMKMMIMRICVRRHVDSLHRMCYNIGMIGSRLIYFKVDLSGTCAMLPVTSPEVTIFTSQKCLLCLLVRNYCTITYLVGNAIKVWIDHQKMRQKLYNKGWKHPKSMDSNLMINK